jgi:hypothetical protein
MEHEVHNRNHNSFSIYLLLRHIRVKIYSSYFFQVKARGKCGFVYAFKAYRGSRGMTPLVLNFFTG